MTKVQRKAVLWSSLALCAGLLCCTLALGQDELPEGSRPVLIQRTSDGIVTLGGEKPDKIDINGVEVSETEMAMYHHLNGFRRRNNLPPLTVTANLMNSARSMAATMNRRRSMLPHSAGIQENIAAGQRSAKEVTDVWINSGGHNANMRTGNREVGLAWNNGYWVQQFATGSAGWGRRTAEVAAAVATAPARATATFVQNHRRGLFNRRRG